MRKRDGWVRLWRSTLSTQAFQNADLLKVWLWCLLRANHAPAWVSVTTGRGTSEVKLEPGQFIFGRKAAAKELRMKPESVRNRVQKLKRMENLAIQPATHYSIITVCNWETYQPGTNQTGQPSGQPTANQRPTNSQPTATDKNKQNGKNGAVVDNGTAASPPKVSVCSVKNEQQEAFKERLRRALADPEIAAGSGRLELLAVGVHPVAAATLAARHRARRIRTCCRYALRNSKTSVAGMVCDALEQRWDLRLTGRR